MWIGRLFQSVGARAEKERSPYRVMVRGPGVSWRWAVVAERRRLVAEDTEVEWRKTRSLACPSGKFSNLGQVVL